MPIRHSRQTQTLGSAPCRQPQTWGSAPGGSHRRRRPGEWHHAWTRWTALLLLLALVLTAALAPTGQARAASERAPQAGARASSKKADKEERAAAESAQKEERAAARKAQRELERARAQEAAGGVASPANSVGRERAEVKFSCTGVTWKYKNFPEKVTNTVIEFLKMDKVKQSPTTYSFYGPTGEHTTGFAAPPGTYLIDAKGKWKNSDGSQTRFGNFDLHSKETCPAAPAFSIEKLQKIAGGSGSYTTTQLTGDVGQTVDYEIIVKNTGNVPLTLGSLTDSHCDSGTISGGPGGGELAVGASTTYACTHVLDEADQSAGSYSNTAGVTGTPPHSEGSPVTHTSNTVVVEVPPTPTPPAQPPLSSGGNTPSSGTVLSSTVNQAQSGVLAFASATAPALKGPQGCVRSSFQVSINAAGVASVTFYLDGRKLRTLTAKNAHKGRLTIELNPAKLKVGAHRLTAKITMVLPASTKATVTSRSVTVLRCRSAVLTPKFTG